MSSTNRGAERRTLDAYYTPDALARVLVGLLPVEPWHTCLEPHVGGGAFARALLQKVGRQRLYVQDVNPDAPGLQVPHADSAAMDFLGFRLGPGIGPRWVIGNPPYGDAEAHVRRALSATAQHVAFLLRLAFLETAARAPLWREHPPRKVWVLTERPSFTGTGTDSCAYGWFWWDKRHAGPTELGWVSWRGGDSC